MSIQNVIDVSVECAVERGDFKKALLMRWMSHANYSATIEPDDIIKWIGELRVAPENTFAEVGNSMDRKVFVRYLWIDNYDDRERVREMLNRLGFYVLRIQDGLEVNALRTTPVGLTEWFKGLFKEAV